MLGGRLGPLEAKLPAGARVARLDAVEVVGELVVLGLCLLGQALGVLDLVLGGQALLLPRLAVRVHLVGQLQQVLVHGVQGEAKLGAVVGDALVRVQHELELRRVALMARLRLAQAVDGEAAQLLEAAGVLLLKGAATLEEAGKVLGWPLAGRRFHGGGEAPTRALAMLALRRLSSVETPTSECSTSCTRCCVCASCADVVVVVGCCSGEDGAGAAASMGEGRPPPSWAGAGAGADAVLSKLGLKLSVLSMGGMAGGAAIVGVDVLVVFAPACPHSRQCRTRSRDVFRLQLI